MVYFVGKSQIYQKPAPSTRFMKLGLEDMEMLLEIWYRYGTEPFSSDQIRDLLGIKPHPAKLIYRNFVVKCGRHPRKTNDTEWTNYYWKVRSEIAVRLNMTYGERLEIHKWFWREHDRINHPQRVSSRKNNPVGSRWRGTLQYSRHR